MMGAGPTICENDLSENMLETLTGVSGLQEKSQKRYIPGKSGKLGMAKPSFRQERRLA